MYVCMYVMYDRIPVPFAVVVVELLRRSVQVARLLRVPQEVRAVEVQNPSGS
jgi:hypothetical protein